MIPSFDQLSRFELHELASLVQREEELRVPLEAWIPWVSPQYMAPVHLAPLLRALERAERERVRICVSVPPRHAKTESILHSISRYLARNPAQTVGYATHSERLAISKSRSARDYAVRAGVRLRPDAKALHEWRTTEGGGMLAAGAGGTWTGHGVNLLVVDDPFKNREEAESQLMRDKLHEWLTSTALTRVEPGGGVVICHTRWHMDDLIGRLTQEEDGEWEVVNLPALDPDGVPLWPDHWGAEDLRHKKAEVGEYDWASLYQGQPRPRGGELFRDPARYETPELAGARIVIGVDPAATAESHADYSVATVLAFRGAGADMRADVLEVYRAQVEIPRLCEELLQLQKKYTAPLVVEAAGVGKAVPQLLRTLGTGLRIEEFNPKGDKFTRAQPVAAAWNEGRVRVPSSAPWLEAVLREILAFTGIRDPHDDAVDSLSLAWNWAASNSVRAVHIPRGPFAGANSGPTDRWGRPIGGY